MLRRALLVGAVAIGVANAPKTLFSQEVTYPTDPSSIDLSEPTLFVVPYTHLDDVWRWSYTETIRDFLKNTLDENFVSFEMYPNFTFNWTGASRYSLMEEYYPEKFDTLKKYVDAGRWFPAGSSWVESDTNIPSTESLIRQLLHGREYFSEMFGLESREFLLPDCFGFPVSLPSVLSHAGIRGFSTQKLTWKSANGIPFNIGRWIGPDGNWVIAALNAGDYAESHDEPYHNHKETLRRLRANERSSGLPIDYFYAGGGDRNNADRGGTVQKVTLESLERSLVEEGDINVVVGPSNLMFEAISDREAAGFPTWSSDLLLTEHSTGTLTSQSYTKKLNRDSELLVDAAERAAVSAKLLVGMAYPEQALDQAWGLLLRNQFHDILSGTSIPKAHSQAWNDGILALNQIDGVYSDAIGALAPLLDTDVPGLPLLVFNPRAREGVFTIESLLPDEFSGVEAITVYSADGQKLPTQLSQGWDGKPRLLFQAELPSVGAAVFSLREGGSRFESTLRVSKDSLENERYRVVMDAHGDISSIYDKFSSREILEKPAQLEFIANFPHRKPAWHIDWKDLKEPARSVASSPISMRVVEEGPVRVAIEVVREVENSLIAQRIRLYSGPESARVEVDNRIDWKSRGALLKAAFHFKASSSKATYHAGIGNMQRGNAHERMFEVPQQYWVDLTDESRDHGVSILTGHKYGSDKPDGNTLRLTLLHSPDTEDWEDEILDRGRTREMRWQDWGRHEFKYALISHDGDWRDGGIQEQAIEFEQRPSVFGVPRYAFADRTEFSLFESSHDQIRVQAIKKAENSDRIIVRLQELHGESLDDYKFKSSLPLSEATEVDGLERPLGIDVPVAGDAISLDFSPFELKTVSLKIESAESTKPRTRPVALSYDTDVFSTNDFREDGYWPRERVRGRKEAVAGSSGSFDGKGNTYPSEMIGDLVRLGNVEFEIGNTEPGGYNAIASRGQNIHLPKGSQVIHLLAAADVNTPVVFKAGEFELPVTVSGWFGYLGQWDNREFVGEVSDISYSLRNDLRRIAPAFAKTDRVAWYASHRHSWREDLYYEYGYLFSYRLEIPEGVNTLTLPNSPFVRIIAISVGDEGKANRLHSPYEDLHRDEQFRQGFDYPEQSISYRNLSLNLNEK
ncbi:MAG: alpha-mannosidase [Opitutales bacterium]